MVIPSSTEITQIVFIYLLTYLLAYSLLHLLLYSY